MQKVVSFDDYYPGPLTDILPELCDLKSKYPKFKVTLFVIPAHCPVKFLERIFGQSWIQLAAHGYSHESNDECLKWSKNQTKKYLDMYNMLAFEKGFKSPDYQYNIDILEALKDKSWWVAIKKDQEDILPKGLKYYNFQKDERAVNGHTWLFDSDRRKGKFSFDRYDEFLFVSEALKKK